MRYLVTGGSGFLGLELIKRLEGEVVVLARNEGKLTELKGKFPHVKIVVGDVSDEYACDRAMEGVDGVFHLAAMKHVGLSEENVRQAVRTNIPFALLEASRKHKPKFIIGISTDKAASRKGVYGSTKFLMERLFDEYAKLNPDTKYRIVRYGNVIYSTGSVLCKWKEKMQKGEMVTITDRRATRFFWTVEQAVNLIFECLEKSDSSKPYLTEMKSIQMGDLLDEMVLKYGNSQEGITFCEEIGLQPGENLHELIVEGGVDSFQAPRYTKEEIRELI